MIIAPRAPGWQNRVVPDSAPAPRRKRGRPAVYEVSPSPWGRWIDQRSLLMASVRDALLEVADALGYPPSVVPSKKTLYLVKNCDVEPTLIMIRLIDRYTGGDVGFDAWVQSPEKAWAIAAAVTFGGPADRAAASGRGARRS